ncbi:hypothetical protein [Chitinilyticum aquatile]|uniref:hypothetical protein n=1 Tax=Chitinilyticum aquatile TaxID=362520 RepID=UPI000427DFC7|nr:hypothetical protein [Chitinilyticum aquatile]
MTHNPYAPPESSLENSYTPSSQPVWRKGKMVIMSPGAALPHCCVKCNATLPKPPKPRTLYWHHPLLYLLIFVQIVVYAIVAMIVRKKVSVAAGLCPAHRKRQLLGIALALGGLAGGFWLTASAFSNGQNLLGALGILLIVGGIFGGFLMARVVYAVRIDATEIRLRGFGKAFLDSLPEYPG